MNLGRLLIVTWTIPEAGKALKTAVVRQLDLIRCPECGSQKVTSPRFILGGFRWSCDRGHKFFSFEGWRGFS